MPETDSIFFIVYYLLRINLNKSLENGINGDVDFFHLQKLMELLLILNKYLEEKENLGNDDDDLAFPEEDENENEDDFNLSRLPMTRTDGVILINEDDESYWSDEDEDEDDLNLSRLPMTRNNGVILEDDEDEEIDWSDDDDEEDDDLSRLPMTRH